MPASWAYKETATYSLPSVTVGEASKIKSSADEQTKVITIQDIIDKGLSLQQLKVEAHRIGEAEKLATKALEELRIAYCLQILEGMPFDIESELFFLLERRHLDHFNQTLKTRNNR